MEQGQDRLGYIASDVQELAGAVAFGQDRLYQFNDALDTLENDISTVKHYRHHQTCIEEYRRIYAMLHTTLESLINWRALATQYMQELNELPVIIEQKPRDFLLQATVQKINRLMKDLHLHIQQLQQMQIRITNLNQKLTQKKRILAPA